METLNKSRTEYKEYKEYKSNKELDSAKFSLRFLPQIQSAFLFSRRVDNSVARSIQRSIRSFMRS